VSSFLISYDINKNSKNIYNLHKIIKDCSYDDHWVQCFDNLWIIKSEHDLSKIYELIKDVLDANDCFLVVEITHNCDGWLETNIWDYINNNIFQ
jgi:hypothetical protein